MKAEQPRITVVVPTYDSSPYIQRCLDSIFNQSYKELEVIVVDDQSTDRTIDILTGYSTAYPNLKIVQNDRKRFAGGCRNIGVELASGRFISFLDSDDWIDTNYYSKMIGKLINEEIDFSLCGVKREYENIRESSIRYEYTEDNYVSGKYALELMARVVDQDISISSIVCNKLFNINFIKENKITFIEGSLNEDDVFMFEACLLANKVGIVSGVYYHQYQRKHSSSRSFSKKNITDLIEAFRVIKELMIRQGNFDELKGAYFGFFNKCLNYLMESLRVSEQDEVSIGFYYKYFLELFSKNMDWKGFIDYCGNSRVESFFVGDYLSKSKYSRRY